MNQTENVARLLVDQAFKIDKGEFGNLLFATVVTVDANGKINVVTVGTDDPRDSVLLMAKAVDLLIKENSDTLPSALTTEKSA